MLVWMFAEHRRVVQEYSDFCRIAAIREIEDKSILQLTLAENTRLKDDNIKLAAALQQAQQYISSNPGYINNVMDLLQKYQEMVLNEAPIKPGEEQWLTPGEDIPVKELE